MSWRRGRGFYLVLLVLWLTLLAANIAFGRGRGFWLRLVVEVMGLLVPLLGLWQYRRSGAGDEPGQPSTKAGQ